MAFPLFSFRTRQALSSRRVPPLPHWTDNLAVLMAAYKALEDRALTTPIDLEVH